MSKDTDSPGTEFKIAAAGPAVTLVLASCCTAIGIAAAGADEFWDAVRLDPPTQHLRGARVVALAGEINLLVLVFNLIPAFPLDGGRIARAIAWQLTGDRNRATRFAADVGRGFSYLLIGFGLVLVVLGGGDFWHRHLVGAHRASCSASRRAATRCSREFSSRIDGISVADVMDAEPGHDPRGHQRRARLRRVLPALPLAVVPGRRRRRPLPRPAGPRGRRGRPEPSRPRRRSARCSSSTPPGSAAGPRRRAARVAARQRAAAPPRRAGGRRRRRAAARRGHRRPGRPRAPRRAPRPPG